MRFWQIELLFHGIGIGCQRYEIAATIRSR
jgi:hypothetical protein